MKKFMLLVAAVVVVSFANAQVLKRLGDRVKQKTEQKAGEKIDKTIDESAEGKKNGSAENGATSSEPTESSTEVSNSKAPSPGLKSYSRYDFVPGDKILYAEDFSQDVIGEFPVKWNTNASGEVVTLDGIPGRWLKLTEGTDCESAFAGKLPENYTVEFDILAEYKDDQRVPTIGVKLFADKLYNYQNPGGAWLTLYPNGGTANDDSRDGVSYESRDDKGYALTQGKHQYMNSFNQANHKNTAVHIALWIQKQRVRVWVNQNKVYDLPKGIPTFALSHLGFDIGSYGGSASNYQYYLSNIKIAAATPDTRSKLVTEGKFSTTGILFDVNSDKIKPTSYGVLKEIAGVLTENADIKVKIIGHTDNDGEEKANLELSKKRAAAVKKALTEEFGVNDSRLETDGMGESKPVAENKTPESKAQNRRVEFVKI